MPVCEQCNHRFDSGSQPRREAYFGYQDRFARLRNRSASNLDSLCAMAGDGVAIHSLPNLHAKIYIIDNKSALVTSANATYGGMYRNLECGLGTGDRHVVEHLAKSLLRGLGANRPPQKMSIRDLESLYDSLQAIKVSVPQYTRSTSLHDGMPIDNADTSAVDATFSISSESDLLSGFKGWLNLTLRGVLEMRESEFDIQELYEVCEPMASAEYPNNRHVRQKLSEQLQKLRDLRLVEFIKRGHYRRTLSLDSMDLSNMFCLTCIARDSSGIEKKPTCAL